MKVAVVSAGFEERHLRLQPHRTLLEMGKQLAALGHQPVLISDGAPELPAQAEIAGLSVRRVANVNTYLGRKNPSLLAAISAEAPDLLLWHLSLSSFIHQDFNHEYAGQTIGVLTSPVYGSIETLRLGLGKLSSNPELVATHLAGSLVPGPLIRRAFGAGALRGVITLSETTRQYLLDKGAPTQRVWTVPPGVDSAWLDACLKQDERARLRGEWGFGDGRFIVTYFGSPAPVRGIYTTLEAVEKAARVRPEIAMVILSRRHSDEWQQQSAHLEQVIGQDGLRDRVKVVDGFLKQEELIRYIQASDVICLPFELVPSDVPLSILEAMALSKGVIGTTVACIPELLEDGRGFLVPPAAPECLAEQLQMMAAQPAICDARGQVARAYVGAQRTWAHMGKRLEHVLAVSCGNANP